MSRDELLGENADEGLFFRPPGQLHDLPVDMRWEVTRRHPYYLTFWEDAASYHRSEHGIPEPVLPGYIAFILLGGIGVTGVPMPPSTPFEKLADSDPAFLSGSVQPVTHRALVARLLTGLPRADRIAIAELLATEADPGDAMPDDYRETHRRELALHKLGLMASPALNSCPDVPLFYVHLGASQRSIERDMTDQARRWKERSGAGSSKVHTTNLGNYLQVWDRREGWAGGAYDRAWNRTLGDIAQELGVPTSTVANRYRSAFAMITGQPFAPELWWRLFGPLKYSEVFGDTAAIFSGPLRRRMRSPSRVPLPETRVSPKRNTSRAGGLVESLSTFRDDIAYQDMLMDMQDFIARGLTDEEISRMLDLADPHLVASLRTQIDNLRSI